MVLEVELHPWAGDPGRVRLKERVAEGVNLEVSVGV
jgi:hypothetical protein